MGEVLQQKSMAGCVMFPTVAATAVSKAVATARIFVLECKFRLSGIWHSRPRMPLAAPASRRPVVANTIIVM